MLFGEGSIWPLNDHKNIHFDNEYNSLMSSKFFEESGCGLNLDLLIIMYISRVSNPWRSGVVRKMNHLTLQKRSMYSQGCANGHYAHWRGNYFNVLVGYASRVLRQSTSNKFPKFQIFNGLSDLIGYKIWWSKFFGFYLVSSLVS